MNEPDPNFPSAAEWASWSWPLKVLWLVIFLGILFAVATGAQWLSEQLFF